MWWRGRKVHRLAARGTEILEVLPARGDERMIGRQGGRGNRARAPEKLLGVGVLPGDLAHDPEVIERVREIGMERSDARLLQRRHLAKQPFGGRVVAGRGGLFRRLDDGLKFLRVRHGSPLQAQPRGREPL